MKLSLAVGTASKVLDIFVQDASVSTGAGLANLQGSTVSYTWWREGQTSVSTGVASTAGAMGVYSTSAWVQVSSSQALGWYQFGAPNGVFTNGASAKIHFYGGANMVATPVEIELTKTDNQTYASSTVFLAYTSTSPSNLRQIHGQEAVTSAAGRLSINLVSIVGSNAVTSAAGVLNVSTQTIDKTGYNATTTVNLDKLNYDITSTYGSAIVTSAAGEFQVSTQTLAAAGSDIQTVHGSPIVTTAAGIMAIDVRSIRGSNAVTSGAGILNVSTQSLAGIVVSTQTIDKTGYSLTAAERAAIASTVLTTTQPESIRATQAEGSLIQLQYEILANLTEFSHSGTTRTLNSVTSGTGGIATYQFDSSSAPSSLTRVA